MLSDRKVVDLIGLVRERFPDWEDFSHPPFVADEIAYKQATVAQARDWLAADALDRLLADAAYETILERLEKLANDNNLLWRRVPSSGDTAVLYHPDLDPAGFCTAMRNLLHGDRPTPDRLQSFSTYLDAHVLPNKWPFPTYFLFIVHPQAEMFVKPQAAQWFLQFVGSGVTAVASPPDATTYAAVRRAAHALRDALAPYGARDMVDVQSFVWVAFRESQQRTGRLDTRGQVELDVPRTEPLEPEPYQPIERTRLLHEKATYAAASADMTSSNTYFSPKTFELLAALDKNQTNDYYQSRKEEFREYILAPFQRLFYKIADQLPGFITQIMETETGLFSRIPKNDFGQGGAWPFYWSAFYPKGHKRTADVQLSMWMDHQFWECGFYIGEYADKRRAQFLERCQRYADEIAASVGPYLRNTDFVFGGRDTLIITDDGRVESQTGMTFDEWLQEPDQGDFDISFVLHRNSLLQLSDDAVERNALEVYARVFPLVLLAIESDPLPQIERYLQEPDVQSLLQTSDRGHGTGYSLEAFSRDTGHDQAELARWLRAIERKGQAVFYGPPGTGKTFVAQRLARHLVGGTDGFWELVQFHPAYAYEDFMQGIRPSTHGGVLSYEMVPGRFMRFCARARVRSGTCVFIIDEINRANIASVFGELMYLLEYRAASVPLAGGRRFNIPENVRILGTMNTADRSIALVDHALRRRFAFIHLQPSEDVLRHFHADTGAPVKALIRLLHHVNQQINDPDYLIGHSFFLHPNISTQLPDIWQMEIEPYLEEYFFDQPERVAELRWTQVAYLLEENG